MEAKTFIQLANGSFEQDINIESNINTYWNMTSDDDDKFRSIIQIQEEIKQLEDLKTDFFSKECNKFRKPNGGVNWHSLQTSISSLGARYVKVQAYLSDHNYKRNGIPILVEFKTPSEQAGEFKSDINVVLHNIHNFKQSKNRDIVTNELNKHVFNTSGDDQIHYKYFDDYYEKTSNQDLWIHDKFDAVHEVINDEFEDGF